MSDLDQLPRLFAQVALWPVAAAFGLGLLATFTPSTFALAPVVVGYVGSSARSRPAAWGRALAFLGGLSAVNVAIGALFGAAGALAQQLVGGNLALWNALAGGLMLLVALAALGVLRSPLPAMPVTRVDTHSWLSAFLLGLPFGLVTCPTCVPLLVPVALGAAATGLAWYGGLLFLSFAIGRGIPLLAVGGAAGLFKSLRPLSRRMPAVERAFAWLLVVGSTYFLVEAVRWAVWSTAM